MTLFYAIGTVGLLLLAVLIVIVQPYKVKFATYNTIDTVLILLLAAWYASILCCINDSYTFMPSFFWLSLHYCFIILTVLCINYCLLFNFYIIEGRFVETVCERRCCLLLELK